MNWILPILLIVAALGVGGALMKSPPSVPRSETEAMSPVVGTADLIAHDTPVFVQAFGTVVPSREIKVMPEVSGRIAELNKGVVPGGIVTEGELLLRIDPSDYEIDVAEAQANLTVAKSDVSRLRAGLEPLRERKRQLSIEIEYLAWNAARLGGLAEQNQVADAELRDATTLLESRKAERQSVAAEFAEHEMTIESAVARVTVSERNLDSAKLALQRTAVLVPFDAIVISENVEVGQLVGTQTVAATLVGVNEFWVEASLPVSQLQRIRFAIDDPESPSSVEVSLATGSEPVDWTGKALRPLVNLDPQGRMARILVSIRDPLRLEQSTATASQRILVGSYVRLEIEAGVLPGVYSIPRKALRENDQVWVRDGDGKLAIRTVKIAWRRHDDVLVHNGFEDSDQLVTTHLASVIPGIPLRVRDESSANRTVLTVETASHQKEPVASSTDRTNPTE